MDDTEAVRERKFTEKGHQYQLETKEHERGRLLKIVDKKSHDLSEIIQGDYDASFVRTEYSSLLANYELLLDAHSAFQKLLDHETAKQDQDLFDKNCSNILKIKGEVEKWFLQFKQPLDDAISCISKRSNVSVTSHVSIERVKEEQKKAELLARQSVLKEKQRIDEEKFKLKLKEEELEIETELKVSDAKSKILEDLERSMVQDSNHVFTDPPFSKGIHMTEVPNFSNKFESVNISTVSKDLNKPKAEIIQFYGTVLDYTRFKRQFNSRICANTDSYDERLNYLLQFTAGEANKIVSGYCNLPAEIGYRAAFEEFEERYGDSELITQTYVKKVLDWPSIKADDPKALDEFAIFLRECQYAVENVGAARVLEYSENLRSIIQKLPYYLHDKWRNVVYEHKGKGTTVKFETLVSFVRKEARKANDPIYGKEILITKQPKTLSASSSKPIRSNKTSKTLATVVKDTKGHSAQSSVVSAQTKSCTFCKGQHYLSECTSIVLNALTDRFNFLKTNGLCFGCLRVGHLKGECRKKLRCAKCQRLHPTILHVDPRGCGDAQAPGNSHENVSSSNPKSFVAHMGAGAAMPIVPVRLKAKSSDKFIETYALLDTGSTATFCSERILDFLGVEGRMTKVNMVTLGEDKTHDLREVRGLEISSLHGDNTVELPSIFTQPTLPISRSDVLSEEDIKGWPHLRCVQLERIDSEVDLLIGVNVPKALEPWEIIPSEGNGPFAIKTMFGWVVNGPLEGDGCSQTIRSNYVKTSLDDQLREHFNRDFSELTINDKLEHSREDKQFMESVTRSISKREGHYTVDLPFKSKNVNMPNNRNQAKQRLTLLSKRFDKDVKFREAYTEFMTKVIDKGYAQRVSPSDIPEVGKLWYLPHHGVFHPKKNKIRVVFDCAARYGGTCLNDQLLQGPNLTSSLVGTLTRFRQESVAIMGDIESMFCQVHVSPKDRNFQRFLWWTDGDTSTEPVEFQMIVHLFGATSSPSCASFALQQTAKDMKGYFNDKVIDTVLRNFYVDDCLKSVETERTAVSLVEDLQAILKGGGFHITKWVSNSRMVITSVPASERAAEVKDLDLDADMLPVERTLGVNWCVESDAFSFNVDVKNHEHTRRGILSTISSIYDPLGFIAPMIVSAKSLLQELCHLQISWDDPIPEMYDKKWCKWLNDISDVRNFDVDRCFKPVDFGVVESSELHHFADASERGYGTVSYLRLINSEEKVHCSFIMGKSRVAPLKKVTIPRLELTAATVAVRVDKMLKQELDMEIDKTFFWTDSMSVLRYIRNSTSRFHTFVANRLSVIHEGSEIEQWHYVNTKLNPADIASRGLPVDLALWKKHWIEAPAFLMLSEDDWPESPSEVCESIENDPEVKKVVVRNIVTKQPQSMERFDLIDQLINQHSSWYKLKRSVGWILRIRDELLRRVQIRKGCKLQTAHVQEKLKLTVSDMSRAESAVIAYVQRQTFKDEITALENGKTPIKKSSSIKKLDPILENGTLRVGGRLDKACMPSDMKHPAILPQKHHVTMLIIRQIHENLKHAGRNHMLTILRERFWVIRAPTIIRNVIAKCVICRRFKAPVGQQKMANLPKDRVVPDEPPFTRVGIDYFGPFEVKLKRSRVKRYGVIFTCLVSRAVHLEVAFSLDADSYINALRRFVARRGQVKVMRSDNGTNFIGGERELRQSINEWNLERISDAMLQKNIDWKFNPPLGSHHGGVWERLIRSVRSAINSTLREQVLDDEGLQTLLCEAEAVLNSRPLTKNSDDHSDLEALTPNHLLLLNKNPNLPPGLFCKRDNYVRRRWKQIQYMANLFWQRWIKEYLPLLQERQKWHETKRNLQVGDVVLIVDQSAPRGSWPMGLIVEILPDRSGFVRQVRVKTASNILTRPIDKLCAILEAE